MSRTGDEITQLDEDMLTQFRGCDPSDYDCYADCLWHAQSALKDGEGRYDGEFDDALAWARTQKWTP